MSLVARLKTCSLRRAFLATASLPQQYLHPLESMDTMDANH